MKGPKAFSGPQHRIEAQEAKVTCVSLKPACESQATAHDLGHLVWGLLHHTKLPKHTQWGRYLQTPPPHPVTWCRSGYPGLKTVYGQPLHISHH